jgi:glycerophosphoryl diester phosphodiesterase
VRAACNAGYGIEIDLQLSADGEAMVFHDYDLERLTGDPGLLLARTATDLGALRLIDADDGIPTLTDVLEIVAGRVPLLIEIKDQDGTTGAGIGPLEAATAAALRDYAGPAAVMSFNPHSVATLATLCPDVPRGLTTCAFTPEEAPGVPEATRRALADIVAADEIDIQFLSHHHADLQNPRVQALRARGLPLLCWTIRSPAEEEAARRLADNVTFEGYLA